MKLLKNMLLTFLIYLQASLERSALLKAEAVKIFSENVELLNFQVELLNLQVEINEIEIKEITSRILQVTTELFEHQIATEVGGLINHLPNAGFHSLEPGSNLAIFLQVAINWSKNVAAQCHSLLAHFPVPVTVAAITTRHTSGLGHSLDLILDRTVQDFTDVLDITDMPSFLPMSQVEMSEQATDDNTEVDYGHGHGQYMTELVRVQVQTLRHHEQFLVVVHLRPHLFSPHLSFLLPPLKQ